jgi:hypothetical protein
VDNILGDIKNEVTTRSCIANFYQHYSLFSSMEPFNVEDALRDLDCVVAMQEELNNFKRNQVWSLVKRPKQNIIDTKWAFHNKQDEYEIITRNKVRLVAKGYSQVEGLNFDETFSSIARLESIRILIAYATHHDFKFYQMDIKSVFLNELIKEEVYMEQPPGFGDEEYTNHVYKFYKVLYGLKQAPRVWYECLRDFLIENDFRIGDSLREEMTERDPVLCEPLNEDIGFFVNLNPWTKSCVSRMLLYLLILTTVIYILIEHILFKSSLLGLSLVLLILIESVLVAI